MRKLLTACGLAAALFASTVFAVQAQEKAEVVIYDWLENGSGHGGFRYRVTKEDDEFVYWYEAKNTSKEDIHLRWTVLDRLAGGDDPHGNVISNGTVGFVIPLKPGESKMLVSRSKQPPIRIEGTSCTVLKADMSSLMWREFFRFSIEAGDPAVWIQYSCGMGPAFVPRKEAR